MKLKPEPMSWQVTSSHANLNLTAMFFQKGRVETKAYFFSMGVCIIRRVVFLIIYIFTNTSMKVV